MRRALLALLAIGLLLPPPAPAAGGPKARADARSLAADYIGFARRIDPKLEKLVARLETELRDCSASQDEAPAAVEEEAAQRLVALYVRHAAALIRTDIERLQVRLNSRRARDPQLRRFRRAVVHTNDLLLELASPPGACAYFQAWKAAGWAADFRYDPPVRNPTAGEVDSMVRDARAVRRALKRMRALGVRRAHLRRIAEGWDTDGVYRMLTL